MLAALPGSECQPSRLRAMHASRACRTAIMIGTALSHEQMSAELRQMVDLEQPWNCPHGRPVLRHLVSLSEATTLQGPGGEGGGEGGGGGGAADAPAAKRRKET